MVGVRADGCSSWTGVLDRAACLNCSTGHEEGKKRSGKNTSHVGLRVPRRQFDFFQVSRSR